MLFLIRYPFSPFAFQLLVFFFEMIFMVLGSLVVASFSRYREFRADAGAAQLEDLRPLTGRDWAAKSQEDFGLSVKALDNARRGGEASVMWLPMEGFGNNQAPYADIPRSEFYWQLENMARVAVDVSQPVGGNTADFLARWHEVNEVVFAIVLRMGGSISAEHGIGVLKRDELPEVKDKVAIELMRDIKAMLDPLGIMNPGKVL